MYAHGQTTRYQKENQIDKDEILRWLYSRGRQEPLPHTTSSLPSSTDLMKCDIDRWYYENNYHHKYSSYADYQRNHGKRRSLRKSPTPTDFISN